MDRLKDLLEFQGGIEFRGYRVGIETPKKEQKLWEKVSEKLHFKLGLDL